MASDIGARLWVQGIATITEGMGWTVWLPSGRLQDAGGHPAGAAIARPPDHVVADLRELGEDPMSREQLRWLCDSDSEDLLGAVLQAIERGEVRFEPHVPVSFDAGASGEPMDLADLAAPVAELAAEHAVVIELVGEDDEPVSRVAYRLVTPDGRTRTGRLDAEGRAEVRGLPVGDCQICFPELDQDAWEYVSAKPL